MEHIKKILEARKATLFANRSEKGSREWSAFNSVVGDQIEMFPVATPIKKQPRYTNVVHINRFRPQTLSLRFRSALN